VHAQRNATFSKTPSVNSAPLWNSTPICLRASNRSLRDSVGRFWPLTQTSPLEAQLRAHQAQQRGLATPDGPMMPVTLPRGMRISTLLKMLREPRLKVTSFSSTA
jgi:hypothetical protein